MIAFPFGFNTLKFISRKARPCNEQLFQRMLKQMKEDPKKGIKNVLKGYVPERYFLFLLEKNEIDGSEQAGQVSHEKIRALVKDFKEFTVNVNGTQSIEKAFVTGGGVSVNIKNFSAEI